METEFAYRLFYDMRSSKKKEIWKFYAKGLDKCILEREKRRWKNAKENCSFLFIAGSDILEIIQ